uniref:Uncharacterized protein n=1 Tax=Medicago truncatula TaxID=3880 RepID=I3S2P3_MEDTR|nr:unknown [Medicago truncatula]
MIDLMSILALDTLDKNSLSCMLLSLHPQMHFEEFFLLIQGLMTKPSLIFHLVSLALSHTHQVYFHTLHKLLESLHIVA